MQKQEALNVWGKIAEGNKEDLKFFLLGNDLILIKVSGFF